MKKIFFILLLFPFLSQAQSIQVGKMTLPIYTTTARDAANLKDSSIIINVDSFALQIRIAGTWYTNKVVNGSGATYAFPGPLIVNNSGNVGIKNDSTISTGDFYLGYKSASPGRPGLYPVPGGITGQTTGIMPLATSATSFGPGHIYDYGDGTVKVLCGTSYGVAQYLNTANMRLNAAVITVNDSFPSGTMRIGNGSIVNSAIFEVNGIANFQTMWEGSTGSTNGIRIQNSSNNIYKDNMGSTNMTVYRYGGIGSLIVGRNELSDGTYQFPATAAKTITPLDTNSYGNAAINKSTGAMVLMNWQVPGTGSTPTLQQVFNVGGGGKAFMTKSDTASFGANNFIIDTAALVNINAGNIILKAQDGFGAVAVTPSGVLAIQGSIGLSATSQTSSFTLSRGSFPYYHILLNTPTANSVITLPSQTYATNAPSIYRLVNFSTSAFTWTFSGTLQDGSGNAISAIPSGYEFEILQQSSTLWRLVSSSYVGTGPTGGVRAPAAIVTSSTTLTGSEHFISIDASSGNVTITLPAGSSSYASGRGSEFIFMKEDASTNTITISRAGSDLINGTSSFTLSTQYASKTVQAISTSAWRQY